MNSFFKQIDKREWLLQLLFWLLLFVLYSFDKNSPGIEAYKFAFFLHYVLAALLISYVLIPRYLYPKKHGKFIISLLILFLLSYCIEELVLEPLFFKDEKGQYVSNLFFTLLEIVPMILTMVSFKLAWEAIKKRNEVEQLQLAVQESELRFLKSQINPHFLFNNLNNLYSYAIENSPKTPDIILELSSVLRYMLYDCKEDFVLLSKEIKHLRHFTSLNELQIEERGNVKFEAAEVSNEYVIAPLILLMFIENAFKHSTASQSDNIRINISIRVSEAGKLHFNCQNTYFPDANNQSLSRGIGLKNVKKRLQLIYPERHQLSINDHNNVYDVKLDIDLEKHHQTLVQK